MFGKAKEMGCNREAGGSEVMPYYADGQAALYQGDVCAVLAELPAESVNDMAVKRCRQLGMEFAS